MLKVLFLAVIVSISQKADERGVIAGTLVPPAQQKISQPIQVILMTPQYTNVWNSDVQRRLDAYWEQFKPAFAVKKELFIEISKQAHREAANYLLMRMRRDPSSNASDYLKETLPDGRFEFKNIPYGEYAILAIGKVGDQDLMWQEFVRVQSPIPQFLELKKRIP